MLKFGIIALIVAMSVACNSTPNTNANTSADTATSSVAATAAPISQPTQSVDFKSCVGNHPSDCMMNEANEKHLIATASEAIYNSFATNFGGGEGEVELIQDATLGELVAMRGSVTHEDVGYESALWVSPDGKLLYMVTTTNTGKGKLLFPTDSKAAVPTVVKQWLSEHK